MSEMTTTERIERLERELAEARQEFEQFKIDGGKAILFNKERAESAERRAAENEADARRYRFMRDQRLAPPGKCESGFTLSDAGHVIALFKYWVSADTLDAAIDAALASEAGKGE